MNTAKSLSKLAIESTSIVCVTLVLLMLAGRISSRMYFSAIALFYMPTFVAAVLLKPYSEDDHA